MPSWTVRSNWTLYCMASASDACGRPIVFSERDLLNDAGHLRAGQTNFIHFPPISTGARCSRDNTAGTVQNDGILNRLRPGASRTFRAATPASAASHNLLIGASTIRSSAYPGMSVSVVTSLKRERTKRLHRGGSWWMTSCPHHKASSRGLSSSSIRNLL